jgi:hypothetical protein
VQLRLRGEVHRVVAARDQKYQSNFVEVSKSRCCHAILAQVNHLGLPQFRNYKIIYRRYAGLFFCVCVDANDNELAYLEAIHLFVEILGAFGLPIKMIEDCPGGLYRKQTPFLIMSASWTWCLISIRCALTF